MEFLPVCHVIAYIFGDGSATPVYQCGLPYLTPILHTLSHPQPLPTSTMLSHFLH